MFPIPDALAGFYLFCFGLGFIFTFASLILGITQDTVHLPKLFHGSSGGADLPGVDHGGVSGGGPAQGGAMDAGAESSGAAHDAGHGHAHHGVSPINLSTMVAFLTWFGGAGYILRVYVGLWGFLTVVVASLAGLVGGAIVFYYLVRVLIPGQRILNPADYRMEGTIARVTIPIGPDSIGEVVYTKGGTRRSEGARSVDGSTIERGTEVVIVRYERGIAYVETWSSFVA